MGFPPQDLKLNPPKKIAMTALSRSFLPMRLLQTVLMFKQRSIVRHFYNYLDDERMAFKPRCMLGWRRAENLKATQCLLGCRGEHLLRGAWAQVSLS